MKPSIAGMDVVVDVRREIESEWRDRVGEELTHRVVCVLSSLSIDFVTGSTTSTNPETARYTRGLGVVLSSTKDIRLCYRDASGSLSSPNDDINGGGNVRGWTRATKQPL
jgi:hypothetical protein